MTRRGLATAGLLAVIALLVGLGVWQLERRTWKLALIAQTEARLKQPAVPAPGSGRSADSQDAYTRVFVQGRYRIGQDTYVQAVTALGGGFWVLSPFDTDRGFTVLVNRGFVPAELRGRAAPESTVQRVSGLLRVSEPGGGFLRDNDPKADRWYSRDVTAIAGARRIGPTVSYFIDADQPRAGWPRGGLTVVSFRNSHLVYALTWFGLALLVAVMAWRVRRSA